MLIGVVDVSSRVYVVSYTFCTDCIVGFVFLCTQWTVFYLCDCAKDPVGKLDIRTIPPRLL